jgi:outer membrane protein TolC
LLCTCFSLAHYAQARISLTTAVDLAWRSNPRVKGAEDDVRKAQAQLSDVHDAYVPSINAGAAVGQSYGYSPYPPTLFTVTGGGLVYNFAQPSYIRAARAGLDAAQLALDDIRETVAEDTALAFAALDHDQQREQAVDQQLGFADSLVFIVQSRLDAGQNTAIDLTQAKLTAAQLRLALLRAEDETEADREQLARLIGLPRAALSVNSEFPANTIPLDTTVDTTVHGYANSAVASAFASAEAKRQQALGDSRFRFRPQINLFGQFNYYATFSDSFAQLQKVYQANTGQTTLSASEGAFGIQINIPIFDRSHAAKARESDADAAHAFHEAQNAQINALDGQSHLRHSVNELQGQAEVAGLRQQLAQQQLDVLLQQLQSGNPGGPQMTPKDEQNARIAERERFLGVVDATYELRQAEIHLMRQTGELLTWLKSAAAATPESLPSTPSPQP